MLFRSQCLPDAEESGDSDRNSDKSIDESDGEHGHGDFVEQRIVVACFDLIVHVAVL